MTAAATMNSESQAQLSPAQAIALLKEGNARFVNKSPLARDYASQISDTASGQFPLAAVVSCIDSRIPTEIVFDQGIGDVFNARIAGNFVNEDILGSLEFACKVAGAKAILIMGHTACGAVKGACDKAELGNLTQMLAKITPAVDAVETPAGTDRSSANAEFVDSVAVANVELAIADLKAKSAVLNEMIEAGEITIAGAMYDVKSGEVSFL
ncbi:MAG: carbonic anhydrase [Pseudomonadales bacterium]|nr:carbonic anhydrase [Pseudomonadales bacterium]